MTLKLLADNIEKIEKVITLYSLNKIKYEEAHSSLMSFGYSKRQASTILEGKQNGSDTRYRNG